MEENNPFAQADGAPNGAFYEEASNGTEDPLAGPPPPAPPPAEPTMPPPPPPSGSADLGAQSFQDLDLSGPVAAAAGPAARFESKAVEAAGPAAGSSASSPDLAVTVGQANKQGEGMSAYFTYEVTTKTSLPQYQFGQFSVSRRFRDFDWLHTQLTNKNPGAIVPALPEKQDVKNVSLRVTGVGMSAESLESRRANLQRFIQRVCAHPLLHTAQDLQTFLEAADETLEAWKASSKPEKPYISSLSDVKQGLLSSVVSSKNYFSGDSHPHGFEPTVDLPMQQMSNYTSALQTQVTAVHKHSKAVIEKHKSLSTTMTGFGLAMTQLGNCEQEINSSVAKGMTQMGLTVDRLANLYSEQAGREATAFDEPMKEYVRLLSACKQAISTRDGALRAFNSASASVASKKEKLAKLRGSGKEDKAAAAERDLQEAEETARLAKQEYEKVAARLDTEMARFQREKLADFKQMVVSFVSLQIEYSKKVQEQWREVLPQLEAIDAPPPS